MSERGKEAGQGAGRGDAWMNGVGTGEQVNRVQGTSDKVPSAGNGELDRRGATGGGSAGEGQWVTVYGCVRACYGIPLH